MAAATTGVCSFLPPFLEKMLCARGIRCNSELYREQRNALAAEAPRRLALDPATVALAQIRIYDYSRAQFLPGEAVDLRDYLDDQGFFIKPHPDPDIERVYTAAYKTHTFYRRVFNRNSIDDAGMSIICSVHAPATCNAFWNGRQMVFGDCHGVFDGVVWNSLTSCLDIIGHELTHGVTQHTSPLLYVMQPGALNEHISDVMGLVLKQWNALAEKKEEAKPSSLHERYWHLGDELLDDPIYVNKATGIFSLRSFKAPGTAFPNDHQVSKMADYYNGVEDDGGVHINSGIPNHAFYLAAMSINEPTWEVLAQIWYRTMTAREPSNKLSPQTQFSQFAKATLVQAAKFDEKRNAGLQRDMRPYATVPKLKKAWETVGVLTKD
jgi:Zn-dependent metalloprotease